MAAATTSEVLAEIYPLIQESADRNFPEFGFRRIAKGWEASQGEIGGSSAKGHLYYYDNTPFCLVDNKTGEKISVWDYVKTNRGLTEKRDVLRELAKMAGYTLPDLVQSPGDAQRDQDLRQAGEVRETYLKMTQVLLSQPEGAETIAYLHGRGYTDDDIRSMELGHNPGWEKSLGYLMGNGFSQAAIEGGLKWLKSRDAHKVVIPQNDPGGRLVGLWGRVIDGETGEAGVKGKYMPLTDGPVIGKYPFGIETCIGQTTAIGVEGIFDCRLPAARGLVGVVGWGRKSPTGDQLASLRGIGVKNLIMTPDNDEEGRKGLEQSIKLAVKAGFNVYVAELPSDSKDLDEFIVRHGVEAFRELSRNPMSCHRWMGRRILEKHDLDADRGEREALDEIVAYEGTITDPLGRRQYLEAIGGGLRLSEEVLEGLFREHREYQRQKQSRDRLSSLGRDLIRADASRSLSEIKDKIEETISAISVGQVSDPIPFDPQDAINAVQNMPECFDTGYPTLDKYGAIQIPSSVVIAARPGHGKTTLCHNIFRHAIGMATNVENPFVFFSLEVPPWRLFWQMIGGETGMSLKELEREVRSRIISQKVSQAIEKYRGYCANRRLYLESALGLKVEEVCRVAARIREIHGKIGAVAVDYIGLLAGREPGENAEQKHAKVISHLSALSRELECVVFAISQISREADKLRGASERRVPRPDQLRYSGQIEQDADAVWGLFNRERDRQIAEPEIGDPDEPRTEESEESYVQPTVSQVIIYSLKDRYGAGFRPINLRMTNGVRMEEWNSEGGSGDTTLGGDYGDDNNGSGPAERTVEPPEELREGLLTLN